METEKEQHARLGLLYGLGAYGLWGVIPLYFWFLTEIPPVEVLAHRILWSFVVLALIITVTRRWRDVRRALLSGRVMLCLAASTTLIAVNWFTYIYAVANERVMESSMGYFINPLVNVLLGIVFLREKLNRWQLFSLVLAFLGVLNLAMLGSSFPTIALVLAFSFAFYGLLRKTVEADATTGLFVETALLAPVAFGLLCVLAAQDAAVSLHVTPFIRNLLLLSGVITTVPLLLFASAARRLRMSTLGFLQYLAPTIQFLLAVLVFHEPFTRSRIITFVLIWMAVIVYTIDSARAYRAHMARRIIQSEPVLTEKR